MDSRKEICDRFNSLHWHDSKLLGVAVRETGGGEYDVRLQLDLFTDTPEGLRLTSTELRFSEARVLQLDLDILGITYCGGDIGTASCEADSEVKTRLEGQLRENFDLPQPDPPLSQLCEFHIRMIHPGGMLRIFAKDFALLTGASA